MRGLVVAGLLALCLSAAFLLPPKAQEGVVSYEDADRRMNAAILAAQGTLPQFLAAALDPAGLSQPGFVIKVALPKASDPTAREHIWLTPFSRLSDGRMTGFLDNDPADLGDLRYGDQVTFTTDMISDWTLLTPQGLAYGQYTSRVMFEDGAFGDTPFAQIFTAELVPEEWE